MGLWSLMAQVFRGSALGDLPTPTKARAGAWFLAPGVVRQARITTEGATEWVDPAALADGSVSSSKLADAAVVAAKIAAGAVTLAKLAVGSGTAGQVIVVNSGATGFELATPSSGPAFASTTPVAVSGVGAVGTASTAARGDHQHPATGLGVLEAAVQFWRGKNYFNDGLGLGYQVLGVEVMEKRLGFFNAAPVEQQVLTGPASSDPATAEVQNVLVTLGLARWAS
jgi:hypothetical protein